jgi:hypothetical protein
MTNRLDKLERLGLIGRSPDPADRRGVQLAALRPQPMSRRAGQRPARVTVTVVTRARDRRINGGHSPGPNHLRRYHFQHSPALTDSIPPDEEARNEGAEDDGIEIARVAAVAHRRVVQRNYDDRSED